jgi:uncharacterized protein
MNRYSAAELVNHYQLKPHPEGGFYKRTYRSSEVIHEECLPIRFPAERSCSSAIYYLLEGQQFSAFHRLKSDELWHFYYGGALNIYCIDEEGKFELVTLGNSLQNEEVFQATIRSGLWFAAQPAHPDSFSFVGCTVSPGFEFEDLEMSDADQLSALYPQHEQLIRQFCRTTAPEHHIS